MDMLPENTPPTKDPIPAGRADPGDSELTESMHAVCCAINDEPVAVTVTAGNLMHYTPFPVKALPAALAGIVSEGAAALGCDPSLIALPVLVMCSGAIGNSRRIKLKLSWAEPALLWGAGIVPSGNLKSPARDLALEPGMEAQHVAIQQWQAEHKVYEEKKAQWEALSKKERGVEPQPPICPRILLDNATYEAVVMRLAEQESKKGLLSAPEELNTWLAGMNQYKKNGADHTGWLSIHGARSVMHDRKIDKQLIYCRRAFVALYGTVQPEVLQKALTAEYRASGLPARLLMTMPPVKRRRWSEAVVKEVTKKRYNSVVAKLLALPMGGAPLDPQPVDLCHRRSGTTVNQPV